MAESATEFQKRVRQADFGWQFLMSMPDCIIYSGAYLGQELQLAVGGKQKIWVRFAKRHGKSSHWDQFETADELYASFPSVFTGEAKPSILS